MKILPTIFMMALVFMPALTHAQTAPPSQILACFNLVDGKPKRPIVPCATPTPTPSPSPSPTPTLSPSPSPTPTLSPSPSPTPSPNPTPTPTAPPTPTPTPSATPTPPPNAVMYGGCMILPPTSVWNTDITNVPPDPNEAQYFANVAAHLVGYDGSTSSVFEAPGPLHVSNVFTTNNMPSVLPTGNPPYHKFFVPTPYSPNAPGLYIEPASDGEQITLIPAGDGNPIHCYGFETSQTKFSFGPPVTVNAYSGQPQSLHGPWSLWLDQLPLSQGDIGSNADGSPSIAGQILPEQALAGPIHHALHFRMPSCSSAYRIYVPPASTNDAGYGCATDTAPWIFPAGGRIRLKASYNCNVLPTQSGQNICYALQHYGAIFDNTASAFQFDENYNMNSTTKSSLVSTDTNWMGQLDFLKGFDLMPCPNGQPLTTCTKGPF